MRYQGGTIDTTVKAPDKKSIYAPLIAGSVDIETRRGRKFTLHRVDQRQPARFFMTYEDRVSTPVINSEGDDIYEEPFTVFTVEGDLLTEDAIVVLQTDNGHQESHWIKTFKENPRTPTEPVWRRNGARGFTKKQKGRPKGVPAVRIRCAIDS